MRGGARRKEGHALPSSAGLYAAAPIAEGTVVLREADMPDCSLPRHAEPCLGVATLDDGTLGLVALRDVAMGENFSIAPSSDEEDEEETDEDD